MTFTHPAISRDGRRALAQITKSLLVWSLDLPTVAADTVTWLNAMTNAVKAGARSGSAGVEPSDPESTCGTSVAASMSFGIVTEGAVVARELHVLCALSYATLMQHQPGHLVFGVNLEGDACGHS